MSSSRRLPAPKALIQRLTKLAQRAIFGTLSESYRTCGQPSCRCHAGEKHGPHLYVSFRGPEGKTTGYYVPQELAEATRDGMAAWQELQARLRDLAESNRRRLWSSRTPRSRAARSRRRRRASSPTHTAKRLRGHAARRG